MSPIYEDSEIKDFTPKFTLALREIDKDFLFNRMHFRDFEKLIYFTIKECIKKNHHWNTFDNVQLLGGIKDSGRDILLKKKSQVHGIIQCKHSIYSTPISLSNFRTEYLKFLLYSIQNPILIPNSSLFTYYICGSANVSNKAVDLINTLPRSITTEKSFESYVNKIIRDNPSIKSLDNFSNIKIQLRSLIETVKVEILNIADIDFMLNMDYSQPIIKKFFAYKAVIDVESFREVINEPIEIPYNDTKRILNSISEEFIGIHSHFGNMENSHIERKETLEIIDWINSTLDINEKNIAILQSNAGYGKSVVLKDVYLKLSQQDVPVITVKAENYNELDGVDLAKRIFNRENISFDVVLKSLFKHHSKVVILIDQLDALSQSYSTDRRFLITYNRLIQDLSQHSEVRIILSIRSHDLNHDSELGRFKDKKFKKFLLKALEINEVRKILTNFGLSNAPKNFIELLRIPNHLDIFCKLDSPRNKNLALLKNLNDLQHSLWNDIVSKALSKNLNVSNVIYAIGEQMAYKNRIVVVSSEIEKYLGEIEFLKSNGILFQVHSGFKFFHQTFYDFVYAKNFVEKGKSLQQYIKEHRESLEIRARVKMVLEYLKNYNRERFIQTLESLLGVNKFRFHIQTIAINTLHSVEDIGLREKKVFLKFIEPNQLFFEVFTETTMSCDWFEYLIDDGILSKNLKSPSERVNILRKLKYLLLKKSKKSAKLIYEARINIVSRVLFVNLPENLNIVIEFLLNLPPLPHKENFIRHVVSHIEDWKDERLLKIFKKYFKPGQPNYHETIWYFELLKRIAKTNTKFAYDELETGLEDHFKNEFGSSKLDYQEKEILDYLFEDETGAPFTELFEFLKRIVIQFPSHVFIKTPSLIQESLFFHSEYLSGQEDNAEAVIYNLLKNHLKRISKISKSELKDFIRINADSNLEVVQSLLVDALLNNPTVFKNEAILILKKLESKHFFKGFDTNLSIACRKLIGEIYNSCNDKEKEFLANLIQTVSHPYDKYIFKDNNIKSHDLKNHGRKKLLYMQNLPDSAFEENTSLKKAYQELIRKFGSIPDKSMDVSGGVQSYSVGPPLSSKTYEKMNDQNWIDTILKYNDDYIRNRFYKPWQGGKSEHSRELYNQTKKNPQRFLFLIKQLFETKNVSLDYLVKGVEGLFDTKYNFSETIPLFKRLADCPLKGYQIYTWLTMANLLITENLIDRQVFLLLKEMALNHEDPISNHIISGDEHLDLPSSVRGEAISRIIHCYKRDEWTNEIFDIVEKVALDEIINVRASILREIAYLNHISVNRTFKTFQKLITDKEIHIQHSSFRAANYFVLKYESELNDYLDNIIRTPQLHKSGLYLIVKVWFFNIESPLAQNRFVKAKKAGEKAVVIIMNVLEELLYLNGELQKRCMNELNDLVDYKGKEISRRFSGLILRKINENNFLDFYEFLKKFVKSEHISEDVPYYYRTLKLGAKDHPLKSLELLQLVLKNNSNKTPDLSLREEPINALLAIHSSLNKRPDLPKKHVNRTLDIFDELLKKQLTRKRALDAVAMI